MKKGVKQASIVVAGVEVPKTERHKRFCEEFARSSNPDLACKAAGFAPSYSKSQYWKPLLARYDKHIQRLRSNNAKAVSKTIALDQKDILNEMMAIGFANAQDYCKQVMVEVERDGKKVLEQHTVRKDITELTRAQSAAIKNVKFLANGTVEYELPDDKNKHPYLKDLGQHLGLFHQKLIAEHRHQHTHQLSFRGVDPAQLAKLEAQALAVLGNEGKRMLGIPLDAEYEDVTDKE